MRLLHCITSVNPATGGPIEGIKRMGAELRRRGHSSEIVSGDSPNDTWVGECPVPVHAVGASMLRYGYNLQLTRWLKLHAREFDVIVVNGLWQYHGLAAWRASHGTGIPYVVFPHGMLDPWFKRRYPLKHFKKWLYWPWAEYRILRDARATIFTCEEEKLLARESFWLYRVNEEVVAYGTADPAPLQPTDRERFFDLFPHLRGKRILLYLGRIHPKKGCDLLIKAFARVAGPDSDFRLVIAGPDATNWRPHLSRMATRLNVASQLTWPGELTGGLKWGAFRAAEAFILPSHQENFGIAVAEALACGLPVLITDKVNIWREIERDGAGFVGPDTVDGLASLLCQWVALSTGEREKMAIQARSTFVSRFEISGTVTSLFEILARNGIKA